MLGPLNRGVSKQAHIVKIDLSTTVVQSTNQMSCNLDDEVAVLHFKKGLYFGLDKMGAYIWQAMGEPTKVSDLCKQVLEHFDVKEERCRADLLEFLRRLDDAGLIEIVECPSGDPLRDRGR